MLLKLLEQKLHHMSIGEHDSFFQANMVSAGISGGGVAVNNAGTKPHAGDGIPWSSTELLVQIIEC